MKEEEKRTNIGKWMNNRALATEATFRLVASPGRHHTTPSAPVCLRQNLLLRPHRNALMPVCETPSPRGSRQPMLKVMDCAERDVHATAPLHPALDLSSP